MNNELISGFFSYLKNSPCSFHAADGLKRELLSRGFQELQEAGHWAITPGGKYFVCRNGSALISFAVPAEKAESFHIIAAHSDSPCFKIKPGQGLVAQGGMVRLNTEKYGGAILSTWFDRPLSVAGRVFLEEDGGIRQKLVNIDRDLMMIPSLAIHLSRDRAAKDTPGLQTEMLPLISGGGKAGVLTELLCEQLDAPAQAILGADLFLYNRAEPMLWGADEEFIGSPRLDDLMCCYGAFRGFLDVAEPKGIAMHCVFDNEEVGSRTRQGAASTFLKDTLERISLGLGMDREAYHAAVAGSFLVSADNAHAFHPGYPDKYDPVNRPRMNGGIVLKHQAEQRYATDGVSEAVVRKICRDHDIPEQEFTNHSDLTGGSTLGNLSGAQVPLCTADIGLAQLGMHSAFESAGTEDLGHLARFAKAFYEERLPLSV